jgi:hypothetical protein
VRAIHSVHLPIYCDNIKARAGALLTLKTIRIGFPTVPIVVHKMIGGTALNHRDYPDGFDLSGLSFKTNDRLIKHLVETKDKGFAVIDSDVVFFRNCEDFETDALIAGEYVGQFYCPIAKALTASRLHTAFLVVPDPPKLRKAIAKAYTSDFPQFIPFDPFAPVMTFLSGVPFFYDACSILRHAVDGEMFKEDMLDRFEHLYSGSYAHKLPTNHQKFINSVFKNPQIAKGFRKALTRALGERVAA